MPYAIYKVLHLLGAFGLFTALGALCVQALSGAPAAERARRRSLSILHGVGAVLLLVSGFGMLATLGLSGAMPGWAWAKVALWLVLGAVVMLPVRRPRSARWLLWILPLLGALAAWLAIDKPF
ncbi:MAG: hypothetical protein ACRD2Z_13010 [Thermoanaerobaculia bacterium]